MRNEYKMRGYTRRALALLLALVMVAGYIPNRVHAAEPEGPLMIADNSTWDRLDDIYGNNTLHSGKVSVDKSVSVGNADGEVTVDGRDVPLKQDDSFLVNLSQSAQVMALTTEKRVPVDVVFVLDTSGSMHAEVTDANGRGTGKNRSQTLVTIVNDVIEELMAANELNRVGVVAFSAYNAGGVDAGGDAANVLSGLAHYTGEAATEHLVWDTRNGQGPVWDTNAPLIRGRNANGTTGKGRAGWNGATNIQAGFAKGAELLMNADTTVVIDGKTVTRMPFLIFLSDGAPVASSSNNDWQNPSMTLTQGDHSSLMVGNAFLPLLTAAYYKQQISQRYYPAGDDKLAVYTMGFSVAEREQSMSTLTLNPAVELFDRTNEFYTGINAAWDNYAANNKNFSVQVGRPAELASGYGHDGQYYFYYTETTKHVDSVNDIQDDRVSKRAEAFYGTSNNNKNVRFADNIIESIIPANKSISALAYNDGYFDVNNADALENAFDKIITHINNKTIASPTRVTTSAEFDGYVTFTDIIGEYMEVKQMHGVLVGDTFYQGRHVARNIGTNGTDTTFDQTLRNVIATRITMANANVSKEDALDKADDLIAASVGATYNGRPTQAFYNETTDEYSNSVVWFGQSYTSGDGFEHGVQYISPAVDDSYEYLTDPSNASFIEAAKVLGANTVCRSYFLYGTAETAGGSQTSIHNNEYMYFMIRVERSLNAPYQQTVTVSVPASLLSMDKVYVTEDAEGNTTVKLEEADPTHVLYEVGLRSDINAYNLENKVSSSYISEAPTDGNGHVNYGDGTYYFFTNDWDRSQGADTHTRAQSKATFYAANNNAFYTYQEKTYLYQKSGSNYVPYTGSNPQGKTLYYMRDVYTWESAANANGEHQARKTQEAIEVIMPASIPADSTQIAKDSAGWYIAKGVYTGSVANHCAVEHVAKAENKTGTSIAVDHPHRTGDLDDPHYTIYLGNNGVLGLQPQKSKTVSIDLPTNSTTITDDNGKTVMVGQTLTYHIDVVNTTDKTANVTATDKIPNGTTLVDGSVSNSGKVENGTITWTFNNLAPGAKKTVSFKVLVTEAVLSGEVEVNDITNTATVKIGNNVLYETNPTNNPPEGKKAVAGSDTQVITGPLKVGDTITYRIRYYNDAVDAQGNPVTADVTVTDVIPAGTYYYVNESGIGSATHRESLVVGEGTDLTTVDGKPGLKWVVRNVRPGGSGVVSFQVVVDASAKTTIENDATITIGDNDPHSTNKTTNEVAQGKISVSKVVVSEYDHTGKEYTIILTDNTRKLSGTFEVKSSLDDRDTTVTFTNGVGELKLLAGETFTVEGLPLGVSLGVSENQPGTGWSQQISTNNVVAAETAPNATVTNTYRVQPVKFQLKGTKNFVGAGFPAGINFIFNAVQVDANGNEIAGGVRATAAAISENEKDKQVFQFEASTYTGPVDRYYKITEAAVNGITGLTCAKEVYYLHLMVTEDRTNAGLKLSAEYKVGNGQWKTLPLTVDNNNLHTNDGSQLVFNNVYAPVQSDPVKFSGTKTLTGRYLNANDFSFQLLRLANPGSGVGSVIDTVTNGAGSHENPSTGSFEFAPIVYTSADMVDDNGNAVTEKIFHYAVREVQDNAENTTYDKTLYYISVTVSDEGGKLVAGAPVITQYIWDEDEDKYTAGNGKSIAYSNTFEITEASVTLSAVKTLTGKGAQKLEAGDFSFRIVEANADWSETSYVAALASNEAPASADMLSAEVKFSPINYTPDMFADAPAQGTVKTKTFRYIVKEDIPLEGNLSRDPSMVYDDIKHKVTVVATYDVATGVIVAKITEVDGVAQANGGVVEFSGLSFENKRNEQKTVYTPSGNKVILVDPGKKLPANLRFSFRVTNLFTGALEGTGISNVIPADATPSTTSVGDTTYDHYATGGAFTGMEFDYADVGNTYWYVIEEAAVAENNGVTYDATKYILKLTIGKDNEGALKVEDSYYILGREITTQALADAITAGDPLTNFISEGQVIFTNIFDADYSLNISAKKNLIGRQLADSEFHFRLQLLDRNGNVVPGSAVNGMNNAAGVVSFGTLNFTTAQMTDTFLIETKEDKVTEGEGEAQVEKVVKTTYTYEYNTLLSEVVPETAKLAGVTYDPAKYIVSIRWTKSVSHDVTGDVTEYSEPVIYAVYKAATGTAVNSYIKDGAAIKTSFTESDDIIDLGVEFKNSYTYTGTSITFGAKKTLSGRPLKANEFGFELYRYDAQMGEVYVTNSTNAADGTISFKRDYTRANLDAFLVDDVATLIYHIKEIQTGMGGITYSGADFWVRVVVEHDTETASLKTPVVTYFDSYDPATGFSGELTADEVVFANKYETAQATFVPTATKSLLGAEGKVIDMTDYSFSFEVVEVKADGTVIMVTDEGNKQHSKVVSTGRSNADGSITFTAIHFSHAGAKDWIAAGETSHDYYFMIREDAGSAQGITYDSNPVYMKVKVTHDGNGKLEIKAENVTYYSDVFKTVTTAPSFTNHYGPGEMILNLTANKTVMISGREDKFSFNESDFNFTVYADDNGNGIYDPETDISKATTGTNQTPGEDNVAPITFGSLLIKKEQMVDEEGNRVLSKTFYYHIVEDTVHDAGITGDPGVITIKVIVTDDGYGNMTAQTEYVKRDNQGAVRSGSQNLFTNTYTATPATVSLKGTKILINKALNQNEFTFVITENVENPVKIFGESGSKEVTNLAGDPYQGTITFLEDEELALPGMYYYTVTEKNEGKTGYTYDSTRYTVEVKVIDTFEGSLEVEYIYFYSGEANQDNRVGNISFTNSYTPDPLTKLDLDLSINAQKQIVDSQGKVITPANDYDMLSGFYFEVLDNKGQNVFGEGKYGVSNADGEIDFPEFSFPVAGEYHYIIREVDNEDVHKGGFTYDTTEWTVHILVRYNDGSKEVTYVDGEETITVPAGQLYIIPSEVHTFPISPVGQSTEENQNEVQPVFSNIYNPTPAAVTVTATKELTGRKLNAHEFTFQLIDSKNLIHAQAGNHSDGSISFTLNYTLADMVNEKGEAVKEKTFQYNIVELIPKDATGGKLNGVTYTTAVKSVSIKVVDDNGVLKVDGKSETTIPSGGVFTNSYTANKTTAVITANKVLNGADVKAFTFDFELVDAAGKADVAHNDANGVVSFSKTYTFEDMVDEKGNRVTEKVYTYTLREKAGKLAGMTYDKNEITVTVTVTDDQLGGLSTAVAYSAAPTFTNSYEGPTAIAVIEATKTLTGKSLKGDDFSFELVSEDGKTVIDTVNNDVNGDICFRVQYEGVGKYTYIIREKAGDDKRIAYDSATYKVTVTVSADENGYLSTAVVYDTTDGKAPAFKNTFTPEELQLVIEATKTLSGRKMKAEEFKFRVHDSQGNLVATGTNDADGKITFSAITFKQAGTYELTVSEVNSGARGMTYDKTKFKVTVEVTEEDGEMTMEVTYPEKGIKFQNKYKKPTTSVATGDDSDMNIWLGMMTLSMAAILLIVMEPYMKRKGRFSR